MPKGWSASYWLKTHPTLLQLIFWPLSASTLTQNHSTSSPRVSFYFIATLTQNPSTSSPRVSFYIRGLT
ncbi:hypothetical protein P8452_69190 [Trifolium repens]|nr:hypothetical protein P8452_69190 [Trifolium repens]